MERERILREIKRTAEANGGHALGAGSFDKATGIRESRWRQHWARWGDALQEAGFEPNRSPAPYSDAFVAESVIGLARRLGHYPTFREWNIERRRNNTFPGIGTVQRMGGVGAVKAKVVEYCRAHTDYEDVLRLIAVNTQQAAGAESADETDSRSGVVYLVKSGRKYKIGKSTDVNRRSRQFAIQLPHPHVLVHKIETDDASGIESYWHRRFESKRLATSEWFALNAADVKAFQRRRVFM